MDKRYRVTFGRVILLVSALWLSACGGDGGEVSSNTIPPNPDFVAKAKAISFSRIQLYAGHVKDEDRGSLAELDVSNLQSGDLITIDAEFEIAGDLQDYSIVAQLIPGSIVSLLKPGSNLGEMFDKDITTVQGDEVLDLGGAYIDQVKPGLLHGVFHAKLPVLKQDSEFQIAVLPSLNFLAADKEVNDTDIESVPMLLDNRKLIIKKLDKVSVKLEKAPDLTTDNAFTQIEIGGGFDEKGFSLEPIFQASVKVDVSTFNDVEDVVFSLNWVDSLGNSFPLGLLSSNADGTPLISTEPHFTVNRTEGTSITLPVVAYAPVKTQAAMIKQATFIQDIADKVVEQGNFNLSVSYIENGVLVSAGEAHQLTIPLISQDSRAVKLSSGEMLKYSVLRAGSTNLACLSIRNTAMDIDTGLLGPDSSNEIVAVSCPAVPNDSVLWRYDMVTKQFVHKVTDSNGNDYCMEVFGGSILPTSYQLNKCRFKTATPEMAVDAQRFEFDGNKIRLTLFPVYLDVNFGSGVQTVSLTSSAVDAPDIFTDLSGLAIDSNGRMFHAGKSYSRSWGSDDIAKVSLQYGGEAYFDYMPVIGASAEGHAVVSASLFGLNADILNSNFSIKRHVTKKLSVFGNNYPDVVVGNGAELHIDVMGFGVTDLGSMTNTTVTESYNSVEAVSDILNAIPEIGEIKPAALDLSYKMNEEFINTTIVVAVVPVTISGGVQGNVDFNVALTAPGVGMSVDVANKFNLSCYVDALIDAVVVGGGLQGTIDIVEENLTFSIGQGFTTPGVNTLAVNVDALLDMELKLLRGNVKAVLEYYTYTAALPPWKKVTKSSDIYVSPYLFDDKWSIFNESLSSTLISY